MNLLLKYKELSRSKKAAIWYVICNILQKGIAFLVIPIYVRLLTTSEYGQYTIFQSWCNILIIFATLNLHCGVYTKAMVDYSEDRDRYTSCMQGLSTVITLVLFIIYIFSQELWVKYMELDTTTFGLLFIYFIAFPSFSFWAVRQRVENKYVMMVVITLLQSVVTPILSLYLLTQTNLRANAVIWGFLISQSLFGLFFYIYQFIKGKCFYDGKYWKHGLSYNIPLIPHYLSLVVLGQIDRVLIGYYCGKDKSGIYGLAFQVSMLMNVIIGGINGSLVPWIYEKFKIKDFYSVKKESNRLVFLIGLFTAMAMLVTPELIKIIGTPEYYDAIWIIPAVSLSVFFTFVYGLFACVEFYYGATKYVMFATTTGALLSITMNVLLLPRLGYLSAGYTSLTCYTVFLVMHYLFMKKVAKDNIDNTKVFDNIYIGRMCLIMFLIMLVSLVLYKYLVIRYFVIALIALWLFIKRKELLLKSF